MSNEFSFYPQVRIGGQFFLDKLTWNCTAAYWKQNTKENFSYIFLNSYNCWDVGILFQFYPTEQLLVGKVGFRFNFGGSYRFYYNNEENELGACREYYYRNTSTPILNLGGDLYYKISPKMEVFLSSEFHANLEENEMNFYHPWSLGLGLSYKYN